MTANRSCPECQTPLPIDAPAGLCPRCLLQRGLGSDTSGTTAGYSGFAPPSVDELRPLFPQLEIIELLGQGGMGAVYKARQPGLDRLVALKILPRRDDPAFAERFTREARALAKLNHPGIVTVHDFGQVDGLYYFVMEFVEGVNLRQAERAGTLTPAEALAIVPQICAALQFAHDAGVVHRDIKPENILLGVSSGQRAVGSKNEETGSAQPIAHRPLNTVVKIADFGLAKLRGSDGPNPLTHTNQVMGTVHYMAPEQWEKPQSVDHRADIYSLGVVFYELLTGELPLGRFPLPSQKVQIDVRLDDVVLRTLEKEPDRRYQHASDVKTDVEKVSGRLDEIPPLPDIPQRVEQLRRQERKLSRIYQEHKLSEGMEEAKQRWAAIPRWRIRLTAALIVLLVILMTASYLGEAASFVTDGSFRTAGIRLPFTVVFGCIMLWSAVTLNKFIIDRWRGRPIQQKQSEFGDPWLRAFNILEWFGGAWAIATLLPLTEDARTIVNVTGLVSTAVILLANYAISFVWRTKAVTWESLESDSSPPRQSDFFRAVWLPVFGILVAGAILGLVAWEHRANGYFPAAVGLGAISLLLVGQCLFSRWLMHGIRYSMWQKKHSDADAESPPTTSKLRRFGIIATVSIVVSLYGIIGLGAFAHRIRRDSDESRGAQMPNEQIRTEMDNIVDTWQSGLARFEFKSDGRFVHWFKHPLTEVEKVTAKLKSDVENIRDGTKTEAPTEIEKRITGRYRWVDDEHLDFRPSERGGHQLELRFENPRQAWTLKGDFLRVRFIREGDGYLVLKDNGEVAARLQRAPSDAAPAPTVAEKNLADRQRALVGTWSSTDALIGDSVDTGYAIRHVTFRANGTYVDWLASGSFMDGKFKWNNLDQIERQHYDNKPIVFHIQIAGDSLTLSRSDGETMHLKRSELGDAKARLVGRWVWVNQAQNPGATEYRADGTFEERFSNGGVTAGDYRWIGDKEIEIKIAGQPPRRQEISFDGRRLHITQDDGTVLERRRKD